MRTLVIFKRLLAVIALFGSALLVSLLVTPPAGAQENALELEIVRVDTSDFPIVRLYVTASDGEGNSLLELANLQLNEDGLPVSSFDLEPVMDAVDVIFVIDANPTIAGIDELEGVSRLEKVKAGIERYADRFMNPALSDRVTIIVPQGEGGRFLGQAMEQPAEIAQAISAYEPEELGVTNVNNLLEMALQEAKQGQEQGRYQAIVLFTDGAGLASELDYDALVQEAQEAGVAFYAGILGKFADATEIDNVAALTEPTGGMYAHMPQAIIADFIYEYVQMEATKQQITYTSAANRAGQHAVVVGLNGVTAASEFELVISPPSIEILTDPGRPIQRVAAGLESPIDELEPAQQTLTAQVNWPDGFQRAVTSVTLLVNGAEVPLEAPLLGSEGSLTFDWDIHDLDQGTYELQLQVTDELGLQGLSEPLPLTIQIQRPTPEPMATSVPEPTPQPTPQIDVDRVLNLVRDNAIPISGVLMVLLLVIILIMMIALLRRRRQLSRRQAGPPVPGDGMGAVGAGSAVNDQANTLPGLKQEAPAGAGQAFLEVVEHAGEYPGLIPILEEDVTIGRDPDLVQIPFIDESVSRLHARIRRSHGSYRIYDEGSASGTYVNYDRIGLAPVMLENKDDIHFGRVHVRFHLSLLSAPGEDSADDDLGDGENWEPPSPF